MMNYEELYELAVKDLVRLSIKSNNIIMKSSFKGEDANEVKEVMDLCNTIYETFVKEVKE